MITIKILYQLIISIMLFSIWAAFALLIINPIYNADLPEYVIGRICIWEYSAMLIAIVISFIITKYWGYPQVGMLESQRKITLNFNYIYFFGAHFLFGFLISIWQFWIFSQKF